MSKTRQTSSRTTIATPKGLKSGCRYFPSVKPWCTEADHYCDFSARASNDTPPTTRSTQETLSNGEQLIEQLDQFMAAMDQSVANNTGPPTGPCPYHWALLQLGFDGQIQTAEEVQAIDQYLAQAAAVQPSMFLGADGKLSTHKDCICWMLAAGGSA
jgi:hypothetical protein